MICVNIGDDITIDELVISTSRPAILNEKVVVICQLLRNCSLNVSSLILDYILVRCHFPLKISVLLLKLFLLAHELVIVLHHVLHFILEQFPALTKRILKRLPGLKDYAISDPLDLNLLCFPEPLDIFLEKLLIELKHRN